MTGCHRTVKHPERYCPEHRKAGEARDKPFAGAHRQVDVKFYSSKTWRRLRKAVLRRDVMCRACETVKASHVDHIVPRKRGGTDTLDNLQGLCHRCHTAKTGRGD